MNTNYLCFASTGDILSLLQICRQSARVFQLTQPQMFRSLGLSQMHSQPSYLLSCQVPHFPLSCHFCTQRKCSHLLRNGTSVSQWLTVHLKLSCFFNLNWFISFPKLEKKHMDFKKYIFSEVSCLWNWFLSVLIKPRVSQSEFLMRYSPAVKCMLQAWDSTSQRGRNELMGY